MRTGINSAVARINDDRVEQRLLRKGHLVKRLESDGVPT
jgi:hypothetical protein